MKLRPRHIAIAAVGAPLAALLVAWIGFFNVGASSGHWPITEWFLELAMRSAVRTYALAVDPPERLPRDALRPAAVHYALGCASCHGAPGEPRTPTVRAMLPEPPDLVATVDDWTDAQLFRIVKHGVRFTGMPAWPSQQRDDEVWMMVAFLRALPGLDPAGYRALAFGAPGSEGPLARCAACHGTDGRGGGPHVPILAGQSEDYLRESLRAYAEGRRASGIMALAVTGLAPVDQAAFARHFAARPPPDVPDVPAGLASRGRPADGIPACLDCHGEPRRNPHFPTLLGQRPDYLAAQLTLFRSGTRGGTPYHELMTKVARTLEDSDITALATSFAGHPPAPPAASELTEAE